MPTLLLLANLLLFLLLLAPAGMVLYLLLLTTAAWLARRHTPQPAAPPSHRFLILIPAHNEATLLPATLANLRQLDYPEQLYEVHLVADNCSDNTAALARLGGAIAHERFDTERQGKGYALQWLLNRLWAAQIPHDAVVILDADTIVSGNFLQVMAAQLAAGARVAQAYYTVRDPGSSPVVGLRYIALAGLHYLRPLGRLYLGSSAGLKGNGMMFHADLLPEHEWTAHLTEDIAFHMSLIAAGERVQFAPDAIAWAEMPATFAGATTQNERWERGRIEMLSRHVPRLLRATGQALAQGRWRPAYLNFDAAMEHLIPPFATLVGLTLLLAGATALLGALSIWLPTAAWPWTSLSLFLALFILLGQAIYVGSGLYLAGAPTHIYRSLLHVPTFFFWKLALYGRVLTGRQQRGWIRTARNEE